jgi:hypothetical protein
MQSGWLLALGIVVTIGGIVAAALADTTLLFIAGFTGCVLGVALIGSSVKSKGRGSQGSVFPPIWGDDSPDASGDGGGGGGDGGGAGA